MMMHPNEIFDDDFNGIKASTHLKTTQRSKTMIPSPFVSTKIQKAWFTRDETTHLDTFGTRIGVYNINEMGLLWVVKLANFQI